MRISKRSGRAGGDRRATMAVELLFVLPILMIALVAMIEFSLLLTARAELLSASRAGARVAAQGGNDDEVKTMVKQMLGDGRLGDAQVIVERVPADPLRPLDGRDRVQVVVHVPAPHVVPDLLGWAGISFRDQELAASTVMNQE